VPRETRIRSRDDSEFASRDRAIAELAGRQHGVVSGRQLRRLGLTRHGIGSRVRSGRLLVVHRGVYAVGHRAIRGSGMLLAAVLACGPGALLSHRSAAALMAVRPTTRRLVEVTAVRRVARPGIEVHVSDVPADERGVVDGIPVTSTSRTLLDLAAVLDDRQLAAAVNQAEVLRLTGPLSLPQLMERYPGRRGTRRLRELTGEPAAVTRSELERRFAAFVERTCLPRPERNAMVRVGDRWIEVDCLWRAQRVALELDGRAVHGTRAAFESDRLRDRELAVAGWTSVRVTWRQLERDARRLEADLRALLTSARRATP
jgi:hypothetical protein